eukprot:Sspe_Gene.16297::Locus_5743_Transcript_1_2_Confidence_0.667_Length_2095::g.16297::m.16297/K08794/CAMK1; calcium/calmodulin-dependent protein kinase I
MHEVNIMRQLQHPNIVSLIGHYDGKQKILIVMNLVEGGTLFQRIIRNKKYSEEIAATAIGKVLDALCYMHKRNIFHRDLKPENLLLKYPPISTGGEDYDAYVKEMTDVVIADFGLASHPKSSTTCGSPCYLAPEVIMAGFGEKMFGKPGHPYGVECDIWSLGVVLYIMLSGCFPFAVPGASRQALFNMIISSPLSFHGNIWMEVTDDAKSFIRRLLEKDPHSRITASEALQAPWITGENLRVPLKRKTNLEKSKQELQKFAMRRHVMAAMTVYRVAGALFKSENSRAANDPVSRYLKDHNNFDENPCELRISVQSQTDTQKKWTVDLGKVKRQQGGKLTTAPSSQLTSLCDCPSKHVCRHIQYVYQWLFVGDKDQGVVPHITDCEERRQDLLEKLGSYYSDETGLLHGSGQDYKPVALIAMSVAALTSDLCQPAKSRPLSLAIRAGSTLLSLFGIYSIHRKNKRLQAALSEQTQDMQAILSTDEFILRAWRLKHALDLTPAEELKTVIDHSRNSFPKFSRQ